MSLKEQLKEIFDENPVIYCSLYPVGHVLKWGDKKGQAVTQEEVDEGWETEDNLCDQLMYDEFMFEESGSKNHPCPLKSIGIVEVKMVDRYGGEDMGSTYYSVYKFSNEQSETVYAKFGGWYASYEGAEYEGWNFVNPVTKTVTVYK